MGMLLTSNSSANALVRPDGFNPPFSLVNCEYVGLFDKDPTQNFAPGKPDGTPIGNMVRDGLGIRFQGGVDYIDTGIVPGTGPMTMIVVADRLTAQTIPSDASNRVYAISSYDGSAAGDVGCSLILEGKDANGKPVNISTYRSASDDGTPTRGVLQAIGSVGGTPAFGMYAARHQVTANGTGIQAVVTNIRNEGAASNTLDPKKFATTTNSLRIGSHAAMSPPTGDTYKMTIYAAMIFKRYLSIQELREIRDWLYGYYRRRGVAGV